VLPIKISQPNNDSKECRRAIKREAMPAAYELLQGSMTRTQYVQISSLREPVVKASKQSR